MAQGQSLGSATGSITINTQSVTQAQATVAAASAAMTRSMNNISASTNQAQSSLSGLAGAIGIGVGAASVAQFGRFAIESNKIATSYARQQVAALELAGSQSKLNDLLLAYERATGGAIDKATALADVTKLQAIGFANTSAELERFARAARGISVAMGVSQDYVISQLTLAIANQSFMRLDQIGLDAGEAKKAIDELKASDKSLTDTMVYQQVILEQAERKFGKLADSAEASATGLEKLGKAWKEFQLQFGQESSGGMNIIFEQWAKDIEQATNELRIMGEWLEYIQRLGQQFRFDMGISQFRPLPASGSISDRARGNIPSVSSTGTASRFNDDQTAAMRDWAESVQEIERQAATDRLDATRQYESQRASVIRDYGKAIVREAQDFALSRLRAEQDFAKSIADIRQDAAQREQRQVEDLARTIGRAREDADERIADARNDAGERLVEMEEDYSKARARAMEDHRDKMLSAAGRLDAIALLEERKRFARQQGDAKDAHDDQRKDLQKQLDERIADERKTLDKSISQAQEAHERQLEDARQADAQRIADMQADFELRKAREDEDRAIRLGRMAEDHQDQLAEMDRAHADRLAQIALHAQEERTQLDTEFRKQLEELDIQTDAWITKQQRITDAAIAEFDRWWAHLRENATAIQGPPSRPLNDNGGWPSLADPPVFPSAATGAISSNTRSITVAPNAIVVYGAVGQDEVAIAQIVNARLIELLEAI